MIKKSFIIFSLWCFSITANQSPSQTLQQTPQDGADEKIVFGNLGNVFVNMGMLTQNPYNPTAVTSILSSIMSIIAEIVKTLPADRYHTLTAEEIEQYLLEKDPYFKIKMRYFLLALALEQAKDLKS